jgi:hypothetical protein
LISSYVALDGFNKYMINNYSNQHITSIYFGLSHTVLSWGGNVVISLCICDEKGAAVKQLGAGAFDGWSAAGTAFVAGRTSARFA